MYHHIAPDYQSWIYGMIINAVSRSRFVTTSEV